jgi:DNA-directed RNA polymerase subunit F
MTVSELIAILQTMPQNLSVKINDIHGGEISNLDHVYYFNEEDFMPEENIEPCVLLQVNF